MDIFDGSKPYVPKRRIRTDGSVDIHCKDCGEFICTHTSYPGFSTAICIKCQKRREELKKKEQK